jgi:hypothetical protein
MRKKEFFDLLRGIGILFVLLLLSVIIFFLGSFRWGCSL